MKKTLKLILLLLLSSFNSNGQNTFQKVYQSSGHAECFGAYQTIEGGYIFTGIIDTNGYKIFMCRTDCKGDVLWAKTYNASSTIGNISQRVIQTHDNGFLLAASAGAFSSYNMALIKTDSMGITQWHKVIQGTRDDVVNSVIETMDHNFVIAGKTNSWGQEVSNNIGYTDVYIAKIDSTGNFMWGKTIGTPQTVDEAFDIIETTDSGYAATGRYIEQGTFYCFLLRMNKSGALNYLRAYGDTNQSTNGYALIQTADGGFAITGSTTIMKNSFQDYPDEFIIKTDAAGDTLWCKSYHGTNSDGSENGSSIVEIAGSGYAIGVATFSYPTIGFVPNKHLVIKTDLTGNMNLARTYNDGGSHYPYLSRTRDQQGYLLSGFTTNYSPNFQPMLIRMDNNFDSGCNETNVLPLTVQEHPPFQVRVPQANIAAGGSVVNSTIQANLALGVYTVCEYIEDSCVNILAINNFQNTKNNVLIYFDGISGVIKISDEVLTDFIVQIFNSVGQLIIESKNKRQIDVSNFKHGIYCVRVSFDNKVISQKVLF
ncbi:MAG: T9SS type A sorting domain-containing protein [Bacteroidia bacterium]